MIIFSSNRLEYATLGVGGIQTNMRIWRPYHEGFLIVGYQLFTSSRMDMPMAVPVMRGTPMLAIRERELPILEDK